MDKYRVNRHPGSPGEIGFYNTEYPAQSVVVSGKYAYVGTGIHYLTAGFGRLEIFDISNPTSPQLKGSLDTGKSGHTGNIITDVFVSGGYVYYAGLFQSGRPWNWGTFGIVDVSLPGSPRALGGRSFECCWGAAKSVQVSNGYAYVSHYGNFRGETIGSIEILDVSNPGAPQWGLIYETPGTAEDVFISGNYAYIADGIGGLRMVNISKPYGPYEVALKPRARHKPCMLPVVTCMWPTTRAVSWF